MATKRLSLLPSITSSIKGLRLDEVITRCERETEMERAQKKRENDINNNEMEVKKRNQE